MITANYVLYDGKPKPRSLQASIERVLGAIELFEDSSLISFRNPGPVVLDTDDDGTGTRPFAAAHGDSLHFTRIAMCILQQLSKTSTMAPRSTSTLGILGGMSRSSNTGCAMRCGSKAANAASTISDT